MMDDENKMVSIEQHEQVEERIEAKPPLEFDTVHGDEATKVLAAYTGDQTWTDEESKRLLRKIDWRLMPVLCMTYLLLYYDKAMLSQAALFGLRKDLSLLTGNRYSMTASIFYLGFMVGAYPAMMLVQRFPIERVACGIVTVWGVCLILTTICHDYRGIYAQRFFLGFLEAGISPMFMMIVGGWYKKNEQAWRIGMWYSCTGYSSIVSPLINYGFGLIDDQVSSWRYMYYFAGALTTAWGLALFWVLPSDPIRAKGFNNRERYILVARLRTNNSGVRNTHLKTAQITELLLDLKFWLMFIIAFLMMIPNAPISTFVPIIIDGFGYTGLQALLLLLPCGAYGGTIIAALSFLAYRFRNIRSYLVTCALLGTLLASVLLWKLPLTYKGALLFATFILPSVGGGYGVLMGLHIANIAGYTKRSVSSSGLFVGYCLGNFVGPLLFRRQDAPRYPSGFLAVVIACIIAIALILTYRFLCIWENHKRDKAGTAEGYDNAYNDDMTDKKNSQFRYIL